MRLGDAVFLTDLSGRRCCVAEVTGDETQHPDRGRVRRVRFVTPLCRHSWLGRVPIAPEGAEEDWPVVRIVPTVPG